MYTVNERLSSYPWLPYCKIILDGSCEEAKEDMDLNELGRWERAVTSDDVSLADYTVEAFDSQNCTFQMAIVST